MQSSLRYFFIGLLLSISIILIGGCRKASERAAKETPKEYCVEAQPIRLPFLGDDVAGASTAVLNNLTPLYRISYIFLGASGIIGMFLGFRAGIGMFLGGLAGIASAVLFSEWPRVVLVPVVLGTIFLIGWGIVWLIRLWKLYLAAKVIVPTADELDTGPKSAGRKLKEAIEQSGGGDIVRKGILYIKQLFKKKET